MLARSDSSQCDKVFCDSIMRSPAHSTRHWDEPSALNRRTGRRLAAMITGVSGVHASPGGSASGVMGGDALGSRSIAFWLLRNRSEASTKRWRDVRRRGLLAMGG
ncbi:uncharacterized protein IUM83_15644 [Phytophthora cinnamomi]|uniref:uncharacterized protein n=1 Tax=Phytophthora cinnamomi TaxID=4785 RepID=UPI003559A2D8|nr:hypothetical protein IUM83_15644 [Phytophthora cinnamomi]